MPPAAPPRKLDASVLRRRLAAVRSRLRFVHLIRGLGWVVALLLLVPLFAGLLDYYWLLPALVRAMLLVGGLVAVGLVGRRYLIDPLLGRTDDLTLALRIEEAYPVLNDSLASAVQFLDQSENALAGESEAMRQQALRKTLQSAAGCDFFRIVDGRGLRLAAGAGIATLICTVALGVFYPVQAATGFVRLVDPFGKHSWPTQTQLVIETPPRRIALNEGLEIKGSVRGVIPAEAHLLLQAEGFPVREQAVKILKDREDEGSIVFRMTPGQIQRSFKFHVKAHDAVSEEYEVDVLPPPGLAFLNGTASPQIRLDFPAYTDLPTPLLLSPGTGNVDGVAGTQVTLVGAADRKLQRVWVEPRYEPRTPLLLLSLSAPLSGTLLEQAVSQILAPQLTQQTVDGVLEADGRRFAVGFTPLLAGDYLLHLEDETGLRGSRSFELRVRPDPAPLVTLDQPSASRDLLMALPTADIRVQVLAEDTTFALRSVFLRYRTRRDDPVRTLPLYNEPVAQKKLGQIVGLGGAVHPPHYRPTRLDPNYTLALKRITHLDGRPLQDGDTLFLQACADDFDTVNPRKEPGVSSEVEIRIVDRNRLELTFNEEQSKIQQEILRQREKQRDVLKVVNDLKLQAEKGQKLTPEEQRALVEAEKQQGALQERIGTEKEGLRADVAKLMETLKRNGMQNSPLADRLADIQTELDRVGEQELPKIQAALTEAHKAQDRVDNPQARQQAANKLRREAEGKLDRAQALKRNDPTVLEQAAARREQQAREAESQGNLDRVRELQAEASGLRQQARDLQKNPVDPTQKETQDELARLEQQAQDLKETADRLEQQPMVTREDATRQNLAQAKQGQEEVDRTLTDLLSRLEPWSTDRELKGEANKILQEQKELIEKSQDLDRNGLAGKEPRELTPAQRADLRNLAEEQQKLEQRTNQLVQKIKNIADQRAEKDAERAQELRQAAEQVQKDNVSGKMQESRAAIEDNNLTKSQASQRAATEGLEKAVKNLEERREDRYDRLAKKLRETEQALEQLQDDLERLRKQRKDAEKVADPQQREQELQRLRKEQERLQNKGQEIAQQLARLRAEGGARGLQQAQQSLEEGVKQLQRREENPDQEQQALDRIEEARQELEEARQQAEEQLAREQLVRVMEVLKRLKERQDSLTAEGKRIQDQALQAKRFTRGLLTSLASLGENEKGLANETRVVSSRDLSGAPVFSRMVERAADAMIQAGERAPRINTPGGELPPLPDAELARWQDLAARRLEQVLKAVEEEVNAPQLSAPASGGGNQPDMGGGSGPAPGDHLPPLAELKLLKILEMDVRQQLIDFKKVHPDLTRLDEKAQAQYQSILRQRQDVRELFDELNRPDDEPEAAQPEPKLKGARQ